MAFNQTISVDANMPHWLSLISGGFPVEYLFYTNGAFSVGHSAVLVNILSTMEDYRSVFNAGFRFTNVPIPQGATILSTTLSVNLSAVEGTPSIRIHAFDENNSSQVSSAANAIARDQTTAYVTDTGFSTGVYTFPDIKTVIQEIVDRGSWASGNALQLKLIDSTYVITTPPAATPLVENYISSASYPTLVITFGVDYGLRGYDGSDTVTFACETTATSKLRFADKNDTERGILLVATDDANASKFRFYDGATTKALAKQ